MFGDDNNIEPEDLKRLSIFFVLATVIYLLFYNFVLEPQSRAMREAARQDAVIAQKEAAIDALKTVEAPQTRDDIIQASPRITIDNGIVSGSIATIGARFDDIVLKNYYETIERDENIHVLSPLETALPRYVEYGWVSGDDGIKTPDSKTQWRVVGSDNLSTDNDVTLQWDNGQGLTFQRIISLDKNFMFKITQKVINKTGGRVTLNPYGLISQKGQPNTRSTWLQHEGPIGVIGESLIETSYSDLRDERVDEENANEGWIGITDKYWLTSIIPPQGQDVKYGFRYAGTAKDKQNKGRYQSDFLAAPLTLEAGQSGQVESHLFVGAKQVIKIKEYQDTLEIPKFDLAVNFGWFWFLSVPFFYALHYLGEFTGNMGVAIILLTVLIRGSAFPLMNASYRSFGKMKKVGPQVTDLREKYAEDKQKLQQELLKLYQKEGVNPMAGCFPILLQIPIFFALYKVLFITIEIRHAPFFGWIKDLSAPDPTSIFNLFGLIDWTPPSFMMIGVWPCMMCLIMIVQKKLNPPPQDQIQRDIMNLFPFIITFALAQFASGLVVYWTVSALIGVIQQMIIMRMMDVPIYLFGQSEDEKELNKDLDEGGPSVHPLVDMAEQEAEDGLFGDDAAEEAAKNKPKKKIKPPKAKKSKKKK
ncbi:MAG: membrane protein insertase YidC [Pseudomonadota bacterium]